MKGLAIVAGLVLFAGGPGGKAARKPAVAPSPRGVTSRAGVTPLFLPDLVAQSQFIWKGEVTASSEPQPVLVARDGSTLRAAVRQLTFRVDRVIKGTAPGPDGITFDLYQSSGRGPLWGRLGGPFTPGWYGLVFLSEYDGRLEVTDPVYPGVQARPVPAPAPSGAGPMAITEAELVNTVLDDEYARMESAVELLVTLHDQVSVASQTGRSERVVPLDRQGLLTALLALSERPDPIFEGTGLAALLRLGDISRLGDAVSFVERYGPPAGESTDPSYQGKDNTSYVRGQVLHAISLLDDDKAAPLLNPLLQSTDAWVRRNVAAALRRISDASSMPYLAAVIGDPDLDTALDAIYGLLQCYQRLQSSPEAWAEFRRSGTPRGRPVPEWDMAPNTDSFRADPQPYRDFWKQWWEKTGKPAYLASEQSRT